MSLGSSVARHPVGCGHARHTVTVHLIKLQHQESFFGTFSVPLSGRKQQSQRGDSHASPCAILDATRPELLAM